MWKTEHFVLYLTELTVITLKSVHIVQKIV